MVSGVGKQSIQFDSFGAKQCSKLIDGEEEEWSNILILIQ